MVNDDRKPKAKISSTPAGRNRDDRGARPFKEMTEPPERSDKAAWQTYWKERQGALPLNFYGDALQPHEIEAYERLIRAGERVRPIPKAKSIPTCDFDWVGRNVQAVEMKSTQPEARKIHRRIEDAVSRASNHPWGPTVKEYFLVDLGATPMTETLRNETAGYNLGRKKHRITRLWVMHSDGFIEEIPLSP